MTTTQIWIMDGHNMIFAIPRLKGLQVSGHREEARRALEDRLRRFAQRRGQEVLVVFDGNDLQRNPDVIREPFFETVYARRSDGEADDRIIHEARLRAEQGHRVTVVTNDVHTLAVRLPEGVIRTEVQAFWLKHIERADDPSSKRIEGDFSDMEREMMARAALAEPEPEAVLAPAARPAPSDRTGKRPSVSADEVARGERIRRKKERGRLRQERRLKRRPKSDRRR
jgi:predicted RNA-binding protein with PIN domain